MTEETEDNNAAAQNILLFDCVPVLFLLPCCHHFTGIAQLSQGLSLHTERWDFLIAMSGCVGPITQGLFRFNFSQTWAISLLFLTACEHTDCIRI